VQQSTSINIWTLSWQGRTLRQDDPLIASTQWDSHPHIGPKEDRIAFVSRRSGHPEVWSVRADGSTPVQLTALEGGTVATPRWHPDSSLVAFSARRGGHTDLYLVSAQGSVMRRLTTDDGEERMPAWSKEGHHLYFSSNRTGSWQIWELSPDSSSQVRRLTWEGGLAAEESMDGSELYFVRPDTLGLWARPLPPDSLRDELGLFALRDTARQVVPDLAPLDYANWHVTADGIYYVRRSGQTAELVNADPATGQTRVVASFTDLPRHAALALAPSGRWGLATRFDRQASDILLIENYR
jgi:dipeptidyl aminopeptidase/acylaminoacyl peptidase